MKSEVSMLLVGLAIGIIIGLIYISLMKISVMDGVITVLKNRELVTEYCERLIY